MTRKCISKKASPRNEIFALVDDGNGSFRVLKECKNYNRHVRGGISTTWRYVVKGVSEVKAREIFNLRTGG